MNECRPPLSFEEKAARVLWYRKSCLEIKRPLLVIWHLPPSLLMIIPLLHSPILFPSHPHYSPPFSMRSVWDRSKILSYIYKCFNAYSVNGVENNAIYKINDFDEPSPSLQLLHDPPRLAHDRCDVLGIHVVLSLAASVFPWTRHRHCRTICFHLHWVVHSQRRYQGQLRYVLPCPNVQCGGGWDDCCCGCSW